MIDTGLQKVREKLMCLKIKKKNYQLNTYDIILKIYRNKQMKFRNRFVDERHGKSNVRVSFYAIYQR